MKYKVFVTESRTYSIEVDADSKEEAEEEATRQIQSVTSIVPDISGIYETEMRAYTAAEVSNWESQGIIE